jgi:DNA polymerase-1
MNQTDKRLFLLDAYALIYRAHFAFINNPRVNSKGMNTSAVFGFTNTLFDLLNKEKPTHIAVVFDTAEPTERHTDFTGYKANREAMPEDISIAIPYVKAVIEAFRIPVIELPGYEADDLIGTLAKKAEQLGFTTYMVTPDKDFGQLVSEHIKIYKPARMGNGIEIMGVKEVCEKFEVERPEQVIDILGLWGDAVDNIPGVPGVGEKTAKALIKEYGSVENILQNTDKLKGKMVDKFREFAAQAIMSKKLATIITNVPYEFDEVALTLDPPDTEKIKAVFGELEFRRLSERVLGEGISMASAPTSVAQKNGQMSLFDMPDDTLGMVKSTEAIEDKVSILHRFDPAKVDYRIAQTESEMQELLDTLLKQKNICFDTETTDLESLNAELVAITFAWEEGKAWMVPVAEDKKEAQKTIERFRPVFESEQIEKTAQNLKYDLTVLANYDIIVRGKCFDTMLAHYLLQPDMRHNMNILAETYLSYSPIPIEELIGKKGKNQGNMRDVELEILRDYACEDADITLRLRNIFEPELEKNNCKKLFEEIEMPLMMVLAAMERAGVKIDEKALHEYSADLEKDITSLDKEIQEMAGTRFNIASPKQLGDVLFEVMGLDKKAKKTKTGQYSTGEDVLSKMLGVHPIIQKILDYRSLQKLKSTYVDALPQMVNPKTGFIHTSFNQAVAATGRLSSNNPNLQNIPIRTEKGREVRKAFVPRGEGFVLLSADYSQVELRLMAELSKDPGMVEAFRLGQDIHAATAAKVYGVALNEVTSDMRRNAKMVNFGIIYGISAFGLSQRLNIPRSEAAHIIEQYFNTYAQVKAYMDYSIEKAREHGFVETIMGRRRYLKDINSANAVMRGFAERNAINAPIQGSAADIIKKAMIDIHGAMKKEKMKSIMTLQVHDELVFDACKEELETLRALVKDKMEHAVITEVPLVVETGTGMNWLEAH